MLTFNAVTRVGEGYARDLRKQLRTPDAWRVLSYLPLAHSFERACVESSSWVDGHAQVFFAESLDTFLADVNRARPTLFISVPRLWLKFQQGVFTKMPAKKLNFLLGIPIVGKLIGRKILRGLGLDQVEVAASGHQS